MNAFKCDLCGSETFQKEFFVPCMHVTAQQLSANIRFHYVQCATCNLVSQYPRALMDDVLKIYSQENYHQLGNRLGKAIDSLMPWYYALARPLPRGHGKRLLDIGAGSGKFLRYARSREWDAVGTEASSTARTIGRQYGLTILPHEMGVFDSSCFDLVTCFHVLEHVESPRQLFSDINRVLSKSGKCIIQIPVLDSWDFYLWCERSIWFGAPQHIHMFTSETFVTLARKCGFKVRRIMNDWISPQMHLWSLLYELDRKTKIYTSMEIKKLVTLGFIPVHLPWAMLAAVFNGSPFKTFELVLN